MFLKSLLTVQEVPVISEIKHQGFLGSLRSYWQLEQLLEQGLDWRSVLSVHPVHLNDHDIVHAHGVQINKFDYLGREMWTHPLSMLMKQLWDWRREPVNNSTPLSLGELPAVCCFCPRPACVICLLYDGIISHFPHYYGSTGVTQLFREQGRLQMKILLRPCFNTEASHRAEACLQYGLVSSSNPAYPGTTWLVWPPMLWFPSPYPCQELISGTNIWPTTTFKISYISEEAK